MKRPQKLAVMLVPTPPYEICGLTVGDTATPGAPRLIYDWTRGDGVSGAFSRDERHLIVGGIDGRLLLLDPMSGDTIGTLGGHLSSVLSIDVSHNDTEVLASSAEGTVRVWEQEAVADSLVLTGHEGELRELAFSPDGKRLISAGLDETARIWHTSTGQELLTIHGAGDFPAADFSPDGRHVATGGYGDEHLRIWDIDSGQAVHVMEEVSSPFFVKYSPDGSRVAASGGRAYAREL